MDGDGDREPHHDSSPEMSREEALAWIRQVGGTVYRNKEEPEDENAWVAVVRTPPTGGRPGKIIMAFGESLELAAVAAEEQWTRIWSSLTSVH